MGDALAVFTSPKKASKLVGTRGGRSYEDQFKIANFEVAKVLDGTGLIHWRTLQSFEPRVGSLAVCEFTSVFINIIC